MERANIMIFKYQDVIFVVRRVVEGNSGKNPVISFLFRQGLIK